MKKSQKKSHNAKKLKGEPFGLVRYCVLRGKPIWFSSLGQRVQFGVFLKFCRTFGAELFWPLQVYRNFVSGLSEKRLKKDHYFKLLTLSFFRLLNQVKKTSSQDHKQKFTILYCTTPGGGSWDYSRLRIFYVFVRIESFN